MGRARGARGKSCHVPMRPAMDVLPGHTPWERTHARFSTWRDLSCALHVQLPCWLNFAARLFWVWTPMPSPWKWTWRSGCRSSRWWGYQTRRCERAGTACDPPFATRASPSRPTGSPSTLAPADVRKAGASFDLPIALGLLADSGVLIVPRSTTPWCWASCRSTAGSMRFAASWRSRSRRRASACGGCCCRRRTRPRRVRWRASKSAPCDPLQRPSKP